MMIDVDEMPKKELKCKDFYFSRDLTDFVTENNIQKENIQCIVLNTRIERYEIFYWE